jgi:hypothetical protein
MAPPFLGFKQMNSVCGLFEGTQESDWESESILEMEDPFRSNSTGKSGLS